MNKYILFYSIILKKCVLPCTIIRNVVAEISHSRSYIVSSGLTNLPGGVGPVDEGTEKLIISALLLSLKDIFGKNVSSDLSTSRSPANSTSECGDYVIIGGSHASLLVTQMRAKGLSAQLLYLPDYRASSMNAGKLYERLDAMKIGGKTTLVLHPSIMDST
jgi:hypothetical protein